MTIHKLRILPIFLLITGLTLTSGCKTKDMSLKLNEPRNIRGVVSYKRSFPDLNDKHLKVAKAVGIRPLEDREEAESMKEKLTYITDNELNWAAIQRLRWFLIPSFFWVFSSFT